jgi:hypothetical protein
MTRALILALCLSLATIAAGAAYLRSVEGQLAAARAELAGHKEAARWRAADEARRATVAAVDKELQEGTGADAPLSDYLRRGAGRVWP